MSEKGLTTINLKKINRSKVYQYIYKTRQTSKMQIVQDLQMGLSTVSQNLNLLEKEGLIDRNGYFDSTGGRKAQAIQIVSDFRISIGIGILKNMFHITAIDLYGNAFYTETIALPYSNTEEYYRQLADKVREFIKDNHYPEEKILGVSIATQGITSPDNSTVIYGTIMNNTGMNIHDAINYLNKKSGLLGISGISGDMRDVEQIAYSDEQSERAEDCRLSLKMHAYRVKKYIGAFYAALGTVDAICFTAGVGENGSEYREAVLDGLQGMGIVIDKDKNTNFKRGEVSVISADDSKVKIYVIPTDEELMIAKDTERLAK